jgi:hypothetical protein
MPFNLMEVTKSYFDGEFINKASSVSGESNSGISKALSAIIPAGLAGILNKATSGAEGADDIFNKANRYANNFSETPGIIQAENSTQGNNDISSLFGSNQPEITNAISSFAGIKNSSTILLMASGLPAILGILGNYSQERNLSASGLSGFMASQRDHIMQEIPSELSPLASTFGLSTADLSAAHHRTPGLSDTLSYADEPINRNNWVVPLIFIIIVIGLLWYFSRSCNQTKPSTAADDDNVMIVTPPQRSFI